MTFKVNLNSLFYKALFLILLFIICLDSLTSIAWLQMILKHIDELITLGLYLYLLLNIKRVVVQQGKLILAWIAWGIMGALSSLVFHYQPLVPTMIDAFLLCNRFLVGYLAALVYCSKKNRRITTKIEGIAKALTIFFFILVVHDIFFLPFFPKADRRYILDSIQLMFPHPTFLATAAVTLLILLGYKNKGNKNIVYMIMQTMVIISTMRSKAIGFIVIYWGLYFIIYFFKSHHYFFMFGCGTVAAVLVSIDQIKAYFFNNSIYSPRRIMLTDALMLMRDHFPLGTGFGTYGSSIAVNYYSPLYEALGYQSNWGMSSDYSAFLRDCFWPTIFAEFGVFGTICYVYIVWRLLKLSVRKIRVNCNAGFAMLMTLIYLLITSIAEAAFFSPVALLMMMLFAVYEKEQ